MREFSQPTIDIVKLANSIVLTSNEEQVKLGKVWQSKPALLVFLRHFACIACRAHATQIWSQRAKYSNCSLVFIGNGSPDFIEKFRKDLDLQEALILTDPSLESFRAAGFRRGFFYILQKDSIINAVKLFKQGHRQAKYIKKAGTHWQLGGLMLINTLGEISYHYISESLGDFPDEPHFTQIMEDEKNIKNK